MDWMECVTDGLGVCESQNFITMATPHLGIRRPQRGSVNFMYNSITKKLFHRCVAAATGDPSIAVD